MTCRTYTVVLFSLLVQAPTMGPLLKRPQIATRKRPAVGVSDALPIATRSRLAAVGHFQVLINHENRVANDRFQGRLRVEMLFRVGAASIPLLTQGPQAADSVVQGMGLALNRLRRHETRARLAVRHTHIQQAQCGQGMPRIERVRLVLQLAAIDSESPFGDWRLSAYRRASAPTGASATIGSNGWINARTPSARHTPPSRPAPPRCARVDCTFPPALLGRARRSSGGRC